MRLIKLFFVILIIFNFSLLKVKASSLEDKISKNLRCLICQGQSVYDSDSEFANSIKILVSKKLDEGFDVVILGKPNVGKSSLIKHDKATIFDNLNNPLEVGRYHSLAANNIDIPKGLEISAKTSDNEIMGIRDKEKKVEGVQFHPESILTPDGPIILNNFLNI